MECKNCGKYYPDDEKQCPWCNHKIDAADDCKIKSAKLLRIETIKGRSELGALIRALIAGHFGGRFSSTVSLLRSATVVRQYAVFRVEYESGRTRTETVKVDGLRYMKLMSLAE